MGITTAPLPLHCAQLPQLPEFDLGLRAHVTPRACLCRSRATPATRAAVHRTPVLTCSTMDALAAERSATPRSLFFKCELFQKTGARVRSSPWPHPHPG